MRLSSIALWTSLLCLAVPAQDKARIRKILDAEDSNRRTLLVALVEDVRNRRGLGTHRHAVDLLGTLGDEVLENIVSLIYEDHVSVRWKGTQILRRLGPRAAKITPLLRKRMQQVTGDDRIRVAAALFAIDPTNNPEAMRLLGKSRNLDYAKLAVRMIIGKRIEAGVPLLIRHLDHPEMQRFVVSRIAGFDFAALAAAPTMLRLMRKLPIEHDLRDALVKLRIDTHQPTMRIADRDVGFVFEIFAYLGDSLLPLVLAEYPKTSIRIQPHILGWFGALEEPSPKVLDLLRGELRAKSATIRLASAESLLSLLERGVGTRRALAIAEEMLTAKVVDRQLIVAALGTSTDRFAFPDAFETAKPARRALILDALHPNATDLSDLKNVMRRSVVRIIRKTVSADRRGPAEETANADSKENAKARKHRERDLRARLLAGSNRTRLVLAPAPARRGEAKKSEPDEKRQEKANLHKLAIATRGIVTVGIRDEHLAVRIAACRLLPAILKPVDLTSNLGILNDESPKCRELALLALGLRSTSKLSVEERAVQTAAVAALLDDSNRAVRILAMQHLAAAGPDHLGTCRVRVIDRLRDLQKGIDADERRVAFASEIELTKTAAARFVLVKIDVLLGGAARFAALDAIDSDEKLLHKILQDGREGILIPTLLRIDSLRRGARFGSLLPLLGHSSAGVRAAATKVAIRSNRPTDPPVKELRKNLRDPSVELSRATAKLIGMYGPEASALAPDLASRLLEKGSSIRTSAARALQRMGQSAKGATPQLVLGLQSNQAMVLRPVLRLLIRIATHTDTDLRFAQPRVRTLAKSGPRMARDLAGELLPLIE